MATNNIARGLAAQSASAAQLFWVGTLVDIGAVFGTYSAVFGVEKSPGKTYRCACFVAEAEMIIGKRVMVVNTEPPSIIGVQL